MAGFGAFLGGLGGGTIGASIVSLILDTKKFDMGLVTARGRLQQSTVQMQGATSKFSNIAKAGMLAAIPAVALFATKAVKAASDQDEALNKSAVIFGRNAKAVEAFADTAATSFGISKTAAISAAATFGGLFNTVGIGQDKIDDMSVGLVKLAADLASFNNVDPTEALEKLRSGLAGEAEPLRQLNIFLNEARVQQEAYASGIAKTGDELTDAQKVQARYNIILQDSAKAQGDFARTADGAANQQRILKAQVEDLAAKVGRALLPVFKAILKILSDLIPVLVDLAPVILAAAAAFGTFWTVGKIGGLVGTIGKLAPAFTGLATTAAAAAGPIGLVVGGIVALGVLAQTTGTKVGDQFTQMLVDAGVEAKRAASIIEHEYGEALKRTGGDVRGAWNEVRTFTDSFIENQRVADSWAARQAAVQAGFGQTGDAAVGAGRKFRRFAHLSEEALQGLREQSKNDLAAVVGSVDGFQRKWAFTARSFNDRVEGMRAKSGELRRTMERFAQLKGVPERFQQWLLQQGPDAIRAFVQNSAAGRDDIVSDWRKIDQNTNASKRQIDKVTSAVRKVGDGLKAIDGTTVTAKIRVELDADTRIPNRLVEEALNSALVKQQV